MMNFLIGLKEWDQATFCWDGVADKEVFRRIGKGEKLDLLKTQF